MEDGGQAKAFCPLAAETQRMKPDTAATTIDRLKINPRKEPLPPLASLPPSGSFFNEKMLFR
jgi:hypothetical protein